MIDIKDLLKAGVHFGHRTSKWSPNMKPYIWGAKNKIHLIDIAKTAFLLNRACKYLEEVSSEGKAILWVGTKKAARDIIKATGMELNMPYVTHRWIGGTLSNFSEIKKAMTRLLHLKDVLAKSSSRHMSKKEISALQKEIDRLERNVGGILNLSYPPAAVVIIDSKKEHAALKESMGLKIPVISLVDTNTDPTGINFVIPGNDDASKSIQCIISALVEAVKTGKAKYEKEHKEELEAKKAARSAKSKKAAEPKVKEETTSEEVVEKTAKKETKSENSEAPKKASEPKKAATTKDKTAPKTTAKKTTTAAKTKPAKKTTKKTVKKS